MSSPFERALHPFVVGAETEEIIEGGLRSLPPRSRESRPPIRGARWVEAARTELGALATMNLDAILGASKNGFALGGAIPVGLDGSMGSAETAFLRASELDRTEDAPPRPSPPPRDTAPIRAVPRPLARTESEPNIPQKISSEEVRAILRAPTALIASPEDHEAVQRITIGPAGPRPSKPPLPAAKSFTPPPRARTSSFVGRLGVAVQENPVRPSQPPPPRPSLAPAAFTKHRVVVVAESRSMRAWNMAAAVLSGLAGAMLVMALIVSL